MTDIDTLKNMMKQLRHHTDGCAWCRAQTFESLTPYTIEEAHELVEAVEQQNDTDILDELGDSLFHILFYTQIAEETGKFNLDDVMENLAQKLERRNPHVFLEKRPLTLEEIATQWERIKATEKDQPHE